MLPLASAETAGFEVPCNTLIIVTRMHKITKFLKKYLDDISVIYILKLNVCIHKMCLSWNTLFFRGIF